MKNSWLLFFIIGLTACSKSTNFTPVTNQVIALTPDLPIRSGDSVSYLALGDSYTYGAGLTEDESFPFQLAAKLSANNYKAAVPSVIASVGWTVNDLLNNLAIAKRNQKFDIVTILIGVNDEHSGTDKTTYSLQLNDLLQQAIQLAKGNSKRVFVISIPDWSVTPFAANMDTAKIKNDVKTFNSINQSASNTAGATYIDISALSEQAAYDPSLTGTDGLHPTAKMYGLWINQFYATITSTFK